MRMWVLHLFTDLACENVYLLLTPLAPYSLGFSPSCHILLLLPPNTPLCQAPSSVCTFPFILWLFLHIFLLDNERISSVLGYLSELPTQGHTAVQNVCLLREQAVGPTEAGSDPRPPIHFSLWCLNPLQDQGSSCPDFSSTLGTTGMGNDQKTQRWQISQHPKTLSTVAYQLPTFQNHI